LGQLETEMELHELTDPLGKRFWPKMKGRDGCRTPMTWNIDKPNGGFSVTEPWLPVKQPQLNRAVDEQEKDPDSVLSFYRKMLKFRQRSNLLREGKMSFYNTEEPVLSFAREYKGSIIVCLFNLSQQEAVIEINGLKIAEDNLSQKAKIWTNKIKLGANGFAFLEPDSEKEICIKYPA